MEKYELTAVISEKTSDEELPKLSKKIQKIIQEKNGQISSEQSLGRKKLAYQISKNQFGTFLVFQFVCEKNDLKLLTSNLNKTAEILRFMISKLKEEKVKEAKKPKKVSAKKAKVEITAKKVNKKEKKPTKPKITKEIESETQRLEKLDEELGKILEK